MQMCGHGSDQCMRMLLMYMDVVSGVIVDNRSNKTSVIIILLLKMFFS